MPWIFGSFTVTPCAITSCHVVISKQGSTIGALVYNRCVTGRRPRDENHAVRFGQSAENHSRAWGTQPIRSSLTSLQGGANVDTPWLPVKDMEKSPPSEYICLSIYLSANNKQWALSKIKWEIYFYKEVFRSFVHWNHKSFLIMYLYYGSSTSIKKTWEAQ